MEETQNNNQGNNLSGQRPPQDLSSEIVPQKPKSNVPKISILVVVVLLIIAAMVIYLYNRKNSNTNTPEVKQVQNKVVVSPGLPKGVSLSPLPAGQLPDEFPKDLIIYSKVQNIQSSKNIIPDNELHLAIQYAVASATPQQVTQKYQTVLSAKKWKVTASGNYGKDYYVSMTGTVGSLTVTVVPIDTGSIINLDFSPSTKK